MEGDRVGRALTLRQPEARRGAEPRRRGQRRVPQPARDGQLPRLPRCVARRLRHAAAPQRGLRGRQRRDRGESHVVRRGVAEALLRRREAHRLVRRRLPRRLGNVGPAAARLRRCTREARGRTALRLHRTAPLAHRPQCRPVDRVQAGHRARDRQRARRQGLHRRRPRRRAASPQRRSRACSRSSRRPSRRSCSRVDARPNALELRTPSRRSTRRAALSAPRSVLPKSLAGVRRRRALRPTCSTPSSACARGRCPIAFVRGVNPGVQHCPPSRASSPRRSRRCRSRSASRCIRTRRLSCAISSSPISTRSSRGAMREPARARSRCSSRRWIRCSAARARRPTSSSQLAQKDPANAAKYPQTDYRSWLIGRFPGGMRGVHRGAAEGHRRGNGPRAPRTVAGVVVPAPAAPPIEHRRRATSSSSPTPRPCSATAAARTSRGCRSCPIRSRRCCGARGSRSIRRRRAASASSAATSSR